MSDLRWSKNIIESTDDNPAPTALLMAARDFMAAYEKLAEERRQRLLRTPAHDKDYERAERIFKYYDGNPCPLNTDGIELLGAMRIFRRLYEQHVDTHKGPWCGVEEVSELHRQLGYLEGILEGLASRVNDHHREEIESALERVRR